MQKVTVSFISVNSHSFRITQKKMHFKCFNRNWLSELPTFFLYFDSFFMKVRLMLFEERLNCRPAGVGLDWAGLATERRTDRSLGNWQRYPSNSTIYWTTDRMENQWNDSNIVFSVGLFVYAWTSASEKMATAGITCPAAPAWRRGPSRGSPRGSRARWSGRSSPGSRQLQQGYL